MSTLVLRIQNAASLHQAAIERLGWTLVHFVWQAAAVALLLGVVLHVLRKAAPNLRYAIACLSLILIVALPIGTIPFIAVSGPAAEAGPPLPAPVVAETVPMPVIEATELPPIALEPSGEEMVVSAPRVPWRQRLTAALEPSLPYLVLGWIAGVLGLSVWHLGGWAQLQRMKRRRVRPIAAPLQARLAELAKQLGIRRAVALVESALVEVPTVVGWIKPVILLPASALTGLTPEQLEAILAHELAHVRRCDYLVNILQTFVEILGFYHPAVWWISQRIRDERENCCDDLAVTVCGDSVRYAKALTHLEEMRHRGAEIAIAATGGSLVARIGRLIGRPVHERRLAWMPGLVALLLVAGVVVPAALVLAGPPPQEDVAAMDEPQINDEPLAEEAPEDGVVMDDVPHTQVLLRFAVVDVFGDRVPDTETAAELQGLLRRAPTGHVAGQLAPTLAELQQPLRDVFTEFGPIEGKGKALVDLLVDKKDARVSSRPYILTFAGQPATLKFGEFPDPNVPGRESTFTNLELTAVADLLDEEHATKLSIDYREQHSLSDRQDANAPMSVTRVNSTIVIPHNEDTAVVAFGGGSDDLLRLLLVGPIGIVYPDGPAVAPPSARGRPSNGPQVLMDILFAKVQTESALDRETRDALAELLRTESIQNATLGQILNQYVVQQSLPPATVTALVQLLEVSGYVQIESRPQLLVNNNQQGEIKVVTEEPIATGPDSTSPPQLVDIGTVMRVTPHVPPSFEGPLRLELGIEWTRKEPQPGSDLPRILHTEVVSTATVLDGRSFAVLVGPSEEESRQPSNQEGLFVVLTPHIVSSPPQATETESKGEGPAQVLLKVRTAAMQASEPPRAESSERQFVVRDGQTIQFTALADKPFPLDSVAAPAIPDDEEADSGIVLSITPHIRANEVACDIVGNVNYLMPSLDGADEPALRKRTIENSCMVRYGGTVAAIGLTDTPTEYDGEPRREVAIFVTAERVDDGDPLLPQDDAQDTQVPDTAASNPMPVSASEAATPPLPSESGRQQIQLDVRTLLISRTELMNLPFEWVRPQADERFPENHAELIMSGSAMGYCRSGINTRSAMAAIDRLREQGQASILSRRRLLTPDGTATHYEAVVEDRPQLTKDATSPAGRGFIATNSFVPIASAEIATFTPHVTNDNEIMLDAKFEFSEVVPRDNAPGLPRVSRMRSTTRVKLQDGDTVIVPGVVHSRPPIDASQLPSSGNGMFRRTAQGNAASEMHTATLITARIVDGTDALPSEIENSASAGTTTSHVLADPDTTPAQRAFARHIAEMDLPTLDREITTLEHELEQELRTEKHPEVIAKRKHLDALQARAEEIRAELKQEFDSLLNGQRPAADPSSGTVDRSVSDTVLRLPSEPDVTDARIAAMSEEVAKLEVELTAAKQMRKESNPTVVLLKNQIEALNRRLAEIQEGLSHDPSSLSREQYLANDPRLRALKEEMGRLEVELIAARQIKGENHPHLIALQKHLDALEARVAEIRSELEQEFERISAGKGTSHTDGHAQVASGKTTVTAFGDDLRDVVANQPVVPSEAPPESVSGQAAVEIEMRVLSVGNALMDAMRQRSPIGEVASPNDLDMLQNIAKQLSATGQATLDDSQRALLLRAVQSRPDTECVTAPKVVALPSQPLCFFLGQEYAYIAGYTTSSEGSYKPEPQIESAQIGLEVTLMADTSTAKGVNVDTSMILRNVIGYDERTYQNTRYTVPRIDQNRIRLNNLMIPNGQTMLIARETIIPLDTSMSVDTATAKPLLVLLTAERTTMEQGPPQGMGGFRGIMPGLKPTY